MLDKSKTFIHNINKIDLLSKHDLDLWRKFKLFHL